MKQKDWTKQRIKNKSAKCTLGWHIYHVEVIQLWKLAEIVECESVRYTEA